MEELLLRALLARDELDVVDEKQVDRPILGAELGRAVVPDGIDQVVGESLRGEVHEAEMRVELGDVMTDRVQQMRLAEADTTVDEERVVCARGQLGDRLARRLRELVRVADDERLEGVASAEAGGRKPDLRGRRSWVLGDGLAVDFHRD